MSNFHVQLAVKVLNEGGVIAYPTEAVFGLGCYPEDADAVAKILSLKNRSLSKGLILVAASVEQLNPYIEFPDAETEQQIKATWPGPITWVLPARKNIPLWITGYRHTVAVRVSAHPTVRALCQSMGAIVSTSANPENKAPATNACKVRSYFGNSIDYILPGKTGGKRQPTEIREAISGIMLRRSD